MNILTDFLQNNAMPTDSFNTITLYNNDQYRNVGAFFCSFVAVFHVNKFLMLFAVCWSSASISLNKNYSNELLGFLW